MHNLVVSQLAISIPVIKLESPEEFLSGTSSGGHAESQDEFLEVDHAAFILVVLVEDETAKFLGISLGTEHFLVECLELRAVDLTIWEVLLEFVEERLQFLG